MLVSLESCWVWDQETADEGQGGGETEGGRTGSPKTQGTLQIPREDAASSPLTVKDLMLEVIEMQLMKNPNQGPGGPQSKQTGPAPTISSILKTDHGFVRELKGRDGTASLATLSVVSSQHALQHAQQPPSHELPKEGLVVVQVNLVFILFLLGISFYPICLKAIKVADKLK